MNPVTIAVPLTTNQTSGTAIGNDNIVGGILAAVGLLLTASKHSIIGVPLMLFGIGTFKFLDCYTVPTGNVYAGQTQCKSIISKMIGPM